MVVLVVDGTDSSPVAGKVLIHSFAFGRAPAFVAIVRAVLAGRRLELVTRNFLSRKVGKVLMSLLKPHAVLGTGHTVAVALRATVEDRFIEFRTVAHGNIGFGASDRIPIETGDGLIRSRSRDGRLQAFPDAVTFGVIGHRNGNYFLLVSSGPNTTHIEVQLNLDLDFRDAGFRVHAATGAIVTPMQDRTLRIVDHISIGWRRHEFRLWHPAAALEIDPLDMMDDLFHDVGAGLVLLVRLRNCFRRAIVF